MPRRPLIFDDFLDSTYSFPLLHVSSEVKRRLTESLVPYRNTLRQAQRYLLDDDFVDASTRISATSDIEDLLRRIPTAEPLNPVTWLEYNPRVKVKAGIDLGVSTTKEISDKTPDRLGILIQSDNRIPGAWCATPIGLFELRESGVRKMVLPHQVVFMFNPTGLKDWTKSIISGYSPMRILVEDGKGTAYESYHDSVRSLAWGAVLHPELRGEVLHPELRDADRHPRIANAISQNTPEELKPFSNVSSERMHTAIFYLTKRKLGDEGVISWMKDYVNDAFENVGMLRWLVTVLSMLNHVPIKRVEVSPPSGTRILGSKEVTYSGYHQVILKVPKLEGLDYIRSVLTTAGRKRLHFVSGHWRRVSARSDSYCSPTAHEWEYADDREYRTCRTCFLRQRRVAGYDRGDASLGTVNRDYRIRGSIYS